MTCFQTGWAALLNVDLWVKWSTIATAAATIFMAGIAVLAACFGRKQIITARKESKRAIAHAAYDRYLDLCLEKTEFSFGSDNPRSSFDEAQFKEYRWFVSKMLFAFEQILDIYPNDDAWKATISSQLKRHKYHLDQSGTVKRKEWSERLLMLINEVIAA
ncbi:hypothetical protein [Endozoicomonas sp. SCSIO W0465]|uniref:hypothetical protein n=1 Tax=Endozoicomonas sp. SCSIO W0465 TaxID=2918516 RepID=UPI0020761DBF|nr:hypothetical protein [Endozoicomonas sp. SCSIO W0465]USE35514.1 hypothetical protein MJO57_26050 [Endozoicomonas sp. SCSIO W0465]